MRKCPIPSLGKACSNRNRLLFPRLAGSSTRKCGSVTEVFTGTTDSGYVRPAASGSFLSAKTMKGEAFVATNRADIFDRLRIQMAKNLEIDEEDIHEDSRLVDDLDADSLDLLELILALKGEFGIAVNDGEVKRLLTELARFLPDVSGSGQLTDQELAEVSRRLTVQNVVEFIADRVGASA